jgi:hypothetical protein
MEWADRLSFCYSHSFFEAALLFVAAQTGFLDGPRIMANMAADQWLPKRFASLSDRLVNQRGVLMMGAAAIVLMIVTRVKYRCWWYYTASTFLSPSPFRKPAWCAIGGLREKPTNTGLKGMIVNGIGLIMTSLS